MFQIDEESIRKLNNVWNLLGQIEVKGQQNVYIMYNAMALLQQSLAKIEELSKKEKEE